MFNKKKKNSIYFSIIFIQCVRVFQSRSSRTACSPFSLSSKWCQRDAWGCCSLRESCLLNTSDYSLQLIQEISDISWHSFFQLVSKSEGLRKMAYHMKKERKKIRRIKDGAHRKKRL